MRLQEFMEKKGFEINTYYKVGDFKERDKLRRI